MRDRGGTISTIDRQGISQLSQLQATFPSIEALNLARNFDCSPLPWTRLCDLLSKSRFPSAKTIRKNSSAYPYASRESRASTLSRASPLGARLLYVSQNLKIFHATLYRHPEPSSDCSAKRLVSMVISSLSGVRVKARVTKGIIPN